MLKRNKQKELECYNFAGISYRKIDSSKQKNELREQVKKILGDNINIDRLTEITDEVKIEIEKAEGEKEKSISLNLPYALLMPSSLIGFLGNILLDMKPKINSIVSLIITIGYIFLCIGVFLSASLKSLEMKRGKIFFLKSILEILNEIETDIQMKSGRFI